MGRQNLTTTLFPAIGGWALWKILMIAAGWGLGYFGQPHILTKFMGIRDPSEMGKAKYLGMSWLVLALGAATLIGLLGIFLFPQGLEDTQQVVLSIVKTTMAPVFAALVLCAILAATTNVMAAHILIVASNLSEDFYKKMFRRTPSVKKLLRVSRISVLLTAIVGMTIAYFKPSTIYHLVLYAWSGLGASFGPLVLLSLYMKNLNRYAAFAGILVGGVTSALWPYLNHLYHWEIAPIIPGFVLSVVAIYGTTLLTRRSHCKIS